MNLGAEHQLHTFEVARTQDQLLAQRLRLFSTSSAVLLGFELVQRRAVELGLGLGQSSESTTVSLPSAIFAAIAERSAPISFFCGKA